MTTTQQMRTRLAAAERQWKTGSHDVAVYGILEVLDMLLTERERLERAAERKAQVEQALAVGDQNDE